MKYAIDPRLFVVIFAVILCIIIVLIINGKKPKQTAIESLTEYKRDKITKTISTLFFVIGGIPLCIYPFVMIANLMSLTGIWTSQLNVLLIIVFCLFLIASSAYPITFVICILRFKKADTKILLSIIPLLHILVIIGLGLLWG